MLIPNSPPLLPQVARLTLEDGAYQIPERPSARFVGFTADDAATRQEVLDAANKLLSRSTHSSRGRSDLAFVFDSTLAGDEAYRLRVHADGITFVAKSFRGFVWAMQTLRQARVGSSVPCMEIQDAPAFAWRGVMLDEGRHFMGEATVKRLLDVMSEFKFNVLHWHLTEDQGWRIEIKRYPNLTRIGSRRKEADGTWSGGFYRQSQIRRIVAYAQKRGIEIVPEIEMPGHCNAALASYPDLGCRRAKLPITPTWGVYMDVYCAGRESTFTFLQDVVDEVTELFPSPYFHIGGDEVPKDRWANCPDCQARIRNEGLKNEEELQSWFVRRIQKMLAAKGKTLMGWDEIMEGGLAPGAVVQVWRNQKLALPAVRSGNRVVLSPESHLYLNAPAEHNSLRHVYDHEVLPAGLTSSEKALVLGLETPLWSEGIDSSNVFLRFLPRGLAAAELFWAAPKKDYNEFAERERLYAADLEQAGYVVGPEDRAISHYSVSSAPEKGTATVSAESGVPGTLFHYTLDGTLPKESSASFTKRLEVPIGSECRIAPYKMGQRIDLYSSFSTVTHLALGRPVTLMPQPHKNYSHAGAQGLVDGLLGSTSFSDGLWLGWQGADVTASVDLGHVQTIHETSLHCLQQTRSWIVMPAAVRFDASEDGVTWLPVGMAKPDVPVEQDGAILRWVGVRVARGMKARYVRFVATYPGALPSWHLGAGGESFIFVDEWIVR